MSQEAWNRWGPDDERGALNQPGFVLPGRRKHVHRAGW